MNRIKVLIVDDSVDDIATISRFLLRSESQRYMVVSASSVPSALETARDFQPDCLIVASTVGAASGLEFVAECRTLGGETPAVMLVSGETEREAALAVEDVRFVFDKATLERDALCTAVVTASSIARMRDSVDASRARESDTTARLEAAYQRASFLMSVGKRFAATLDDDAVIELIPALAFPFVGDACLIDLVEASVLYRRSVSLDDGRYPVLAERELAGIAPTIDAADGVPAVVRTGRPAFYDEPGLFAVARYDADVAELRREGMRSLAIAPLLSGGRCIGTLSFGSAETAYYRDERRAVVEEFAQRAAVAIANARVVESARVARDQAESARRRLSFLSRVSTLFSRSLDFEATFARLTKICVASLCDTAEIFLFNEGGRSLRHLAVASTSADTERVVRRLRKRRPPTIEDPTGPGRAAATGRSEFYAENVLHAVREIGPDAGSLALYREWGMTSSISAPFAIRGEVAGVIVLVRDRSGHAFSSVDVSLAEDVARRCASYYENARLYAREHSIASALQHSLLPARLPEIAGTRLASRYVAGADGMDVGGDWYDVVPLGDGRVAITIGDVVGRGMLAAATMGQLRDILRAYAFEDFSPAHALSRLNALLFRRSGDYFATAISLVYDPARAEIVYARAGHPPPIVVGPGGDVTLLEEGGGLPVGASPLAEYDEATVPFSPGSSLVLYTDGLVESRERSADEGIAALAAGLREAETDPELLVDRLLDDLAPNAADDTALLVIRALAAGEERRRTWIRPSLDEREASRLRKEATAHVRDYAPPDASIDDCALVIGELLGNVARHATGTVRLSVEIAGDVAIVEVADRGPGLEETDRPAGDRSVSADALATSGRGLLIARAISSEVTLRARRGGGLLVRAVVPLRAFVRS